MAKKKVAKRKPTTKAKPKPEEFSEYVEGVEYYNPPAYTIHEYLEDLTKKLVNEAEKVKGTGKLSQRSKRNFANALSNIDWITRHPDKLEVFFATLRLGAALDRIGPLFLKQATVNKSVAATKAKNTKWSTEVDAAARSINDSLAVSITSEDERAKLIRAKLNKEHGISRGLSTIKRRLFTPDV